MRIIKAIIISIFGIIGVVTLLFSVISAINAYKSESWPFVSGYIKFAECGQFVDVRGGASAKKIRYEYTVNNLVYQSDREYFGIPIARNSCVAGYTPSQAVSVYYDPSNPENAVLVTGQTRENFFGLIVGLLFSIFAILAFMLDRRTR